eukprot:381521_1
MSAKKIFKAILDELLVRNVRWIVKEYPRRYDKQTVKEFDIELAFRNSKTALRIFMFQYYFMCKICGVGSVTPFEQFEELNKSLGCISSDISSKLQAFCDKIGKVETWQQFFSLLGFKYPGRLEMKRRLKYAVDTSLQRGYHRSLERKARVYNDPEHLINQSLLFETVQEDDIKMLQKLLRIENKKNMKDIDQKDEIDSKDIVLFDKNMTDIYGRAPLFYAANNCSLEMVQLLIDKGFNAIIIDSKGQTVVKYGLLGKTTHNAKQMNQIVKLLKKEMKKQSKKQNQNKKQKQNKNLKILTRDLMIQGLPIDLNKNDIKVILSRYGFVCDIDDKSIWLTNDTKRNYIRVKVTEKNVSQKMKEMNIALCFGCRIKVGFSDWDKYKNTNKKRINKNKPVHVVSISIGAKNMKGRGQRGRGKETMRGRAVTRGRVNKGKISYTML